MKFAYIEKRLGKALLQVDLPEWRCWLGGGSFPFVWARLIREMLKLPHPLSLLKPSIGRGMKMVTRVLHTFGWLHISLGRDDFPSGLISCLPRVIIMSRGVTDTLSFLSVLPLHKVRKCNPRGINLVQKYYMCLRKITGIYHHPVTFIATRKWNYLGISKLL